jgi:hypothetical protein
MARFSYTFRPGKHIERRMLVDACRRLRSFAPLQDYEYVGFGGFEFVDFELMHRELGISRLVSIEQDSYAKDRSLFNRPVQGVTVHFNRASDVLPDLLDIPVLRILWLDYEQRLNREVLQDVATAARRLQAGSLLIATVNAHPPKPADSRRAVLVEDVGTDRVPATATDASLAQWGLADVQRRILTDEIENALTLRNDKARFEQIFYFQYSDDAQMMTWGGVLLTPAQDEGWINASFGELEQVRRGDQPMRIEVPLLTVKEAIYLNSQLPSQPGSGGLAAAAIPESQLRAYASLYRWYPPVPTPM